MPGVWRTLPVKFLRLDVRPAGAERGGSWQEEEVVLVLLEEKEVETAALSLLCTL